MKNKKKIFQTVPCSSDYLKQLVEVYILPLATLPLNSNYGYCIQTLELAIKTKTQQILSLFLKHPSPVDC